MKAWDTTGIHWRTLVAPGVYVRTIRIVSWNQNYVRSKEGMNGVEYGSVRSSVMKVLSVWGVSDSPLAGRMSYRLEKVNSQCIFSRNRGLLWFVWCGDVGYKCQSRLVFVEGILVAASYRRSWNLPYVTYDALLQQNNAHLHDIACVTACPAAAVASMVT